MTTDQNLSEPGLIEDPYAIGLPEDPHEVDKKEHPHEVNKPKANSSTSTSKMVEILPCHACTVHVVLILVKFLTLIITLFVKNIFVRFPAKLDCTSYLKYFIH